MENFMLDKITSDEYKILEYYREWFGWHEDYSRNCHTIPVKEVLREEWANANINLCKLLGDNLIISKEFEFEMSEEELYNEMYAMTECRKEYGREHRVGWRFVKSFYDWLDETYPLYGYFRSLTKEITQEQEEKNRININTRNHLMELMSSDTLVHNVFEGEAFSLTLPNGKIYTVHTGSKPMKALSKIANAFDIPYFEDFRICHSLVHNQKKIKGELTLSIHPLDYWTMSDNDCDWDSCMSWREYGSYRQGTIEMMNSPSVVVAYIKASEPMKIGNNMEWTNKKWRQLFIVDKDVILGIKDYPYRNPNLSCIVAKWLKELAETNLGWKYNTEEPEHYNYDTYFTNPNYPEEEKFRFSFTSNHMYTDVGSLKWHPIYVGSEVRSSDFKHKYDAEAVYYYNYSGAAQCISCGEIAPDLYDDSYLCCYECEQYLRCSECGAYIREEDAYILGDSYFCECCWNEYVQFCPCCEDYESIDDFVIVKFLPRLDEEARKAVEDKFGIIEERLAVQGYNHEFPCQEIEICNKCWNDFSNKYLKSGGKTFSFQNNYGCRSYGVYIDDLNEDGLETFISYPILNDIKDKVKPIELIKKFLMYNQEIVKILD